MKRKNEQASKNPQLSFIYDKQIAIIKEEDAFWLSLVKEVNEITGETISGVQEVVRTGIAKLESLRQSISKGLNVRTLILPQ